MIEKVMSLPFTAQISSPQKRIQQQTTTQQSSGSEELRLYYLLVPVTPGIVSFATKSEKVVKSKKIID